MKVTLLVQDGDRQIFQSGECKNPQGKIGHVVVKVMATSVNPIDVKLRKNKLPFSRALPAILHGDFAGIVESVGKGVTTFKVGDEVYGCAGGVSGTEGGALAEFMLVDADLISHKPKTLSFAGAAVLPLVALTAWEALVDKLQVQPHQKVLIHGATGGVGHVSVQLAAWLGADVSATAGTKTQLEWARKNGAKGVINYREETVESYVERLTDGEGFDAIFDTVGGENLKNSVKAMRPNGSIACSATGGMHDLTDLYLKGGSIRSVLMLIPMLTGKGRAHHGEILQKIAELVDGGFIKPLMDPRAFSFETVQEAHEYLESGKAVGKVSISRD